MSKNNDDTKKDGFGITLKFSNNNRFYYGSMYDKDHIVETNEKVTVEKKVYESVLRNTLRVNELEEENAKLKELLKEYRGVLLTYSNMHGNYELYDKINEMLK